MAGGNKLEILMNFKSNDSPLNKLKAKMQSLLPAATKVEEKVSKIGNKVGGSGLEKLKAKMASLIPSATQLQNKINGLANKIKNFRFENITNSLINGVERIPLVGKKVAQGLDAIRDKFNSLRGVGSSLGNLFPKLGEKVKGAFKPENLKKFASALKDIGSKIKGIIGKLGGLLGKLGAIGGVVGGLSFAGIAKASDENSLRNSRLGMVTNDVAGLKQKTFVASQSSGADYGAQLDSIAKLKMLTKGLFNDNEAVKFTSTLDKAFKVSGTGAEEAKSAMYQLNQAMTSGKLQGDEFRSVMENAPILTQKIAESMGVSMAQLKKLGSEGKITSDVIKKAVLGSADDIEAKYNQMPLTFGKVWQNAQSAGQQAMDGLLTKVNQLLNTPMGQKMAQDLQGAFTGFAGMANGALDGILSIFGKLNFAPLLEPLKGIGQTISQAFSGIGGEGLTNGIAGALNGIISLAGKVAGVVGQMISGINFGQISQIFGDIMNAFNSFWSSLDLGSIGNMLSMAFSGFMQIVTMLTPALAPILQTLAVIVNLAIQIGTALMPIISIVLQIGAVLISAIVPIVQIVIGVFAGLAGVVIGVFSAIIGVVASVMGAILAVVSGVINSIGAIVNKVAVFFTQGFNKAKSVAQGVINAIKGFFDGLAGKVSEIAGKIAGMFKVKPPSWLGFLGGGKGRYIGDKSWEGGPVTVAEKGAEMIRLPSGQQFLANEEMTMNLPQGTRISTAEATRRMMRDQFGNSSKKSIDSKKSSSGSSKTSGGNNQYTFAPTVVIENTGGDTKDLKRTIKEILREFFEEKFIAMGG
ncbi:tape measure protein [Leptotrichia trevisanii]|uniref:tape measure protein n=1 Tax=Leptotrichia trevisanii TaxID=109328 RepID=UPI000429CDB0|nr:tape measure protein [Leptotrichia trevisanii]